MATQVSENALDAILALQFTIAWAGEGRCAPRRLGWWDTDLIDPSGGGDLFARLLPQTHAWAALEAVRRAARRSDQKARDQMAYPDKMRTLFFLGFEVDEQLADRLASLKRGGLSPATVLPLPLPLTADFSKAALVGALQGEDSAFRVVPGGRHLKGGHSDGPDALARRLAGALIPLAEKYPLPFFQLES